MILRIDTSVLTCCVNIMPMGSGFGDIKTGNNPNEKHHPFLICMRHGDAGFKYHKVFSEMGLDSGYAQHISFVELLNVPTMDDPSDDPHHHVFNLLLHQSKDYLNTLLTQLVGPTRRVVFVPNSAIKPMERIEVAPFFYREIFNRHTPIIGAGPMRLFQYQNIDVYKCYHFSDSRGRGQLENMKRIIDDYI